MQVPGILKSKVFLCNVPATVEETQVRSVVVEIGKVIGFFYMRDVQNGDRGFAFITYQNESDAHLAVSKLNGKFLFENAIRPVLVKLTCEKIKSLDNPGLVFVDPCKLLPSANWEEYRSEEGHAYYHNSTTGETVWEKPKFFTVKHIENSIDMISGTVGDGQQQSGYGPSGANLFIFHIPPEWKDEDLKNIFEPKGQLVSCKISCEDNGRSRGFGFVSYTTRESAANALQSLNGMPAGGKFLKVTIKQGEEEYAVAPAMTLPISL